MNPKPSDLFNRIPSVSELLEKPQVRALADRWSRSTVAAGLRSFLDELRTDLQRRASKAGMPSARELAERAARYVIALQEHVERPAINASGRIYGAPFSAGPIGDAALERMVAFGREFVIGPAPAKEQDALALATDSVSILCRLTGAQSALAVHSYTGAVWLALAASAEGGEILVARSQLGDVESGCGLAQMAAATGVTLREVGATNRVSIRDYESATKGAGAILTICSDEYAIQGKAESIEFESLAALARDRQIPLISAIGGAPLSDVPYLSGAVRESARARLAGGADLVIIRGDGLVGGPKCGVLLGGRDLILQIMSHPLFVAWQLDSPRSAALTATLESLEAKSEESPVPLLELLAAPVENLRNRAERIVSQLASVTGIASLEAVPTHSPLLAACVDQAGMKSHAVSLTPADGDAAALYRRFASAPQAIVGRVEGEKLLLDLRTVFPRQDQSLVDAISGKLSGAGVP